MLARLYGIAMYKKLLPFVLIAILSALIAGGAVFAWQNQQKKISQKEQIIAIASASHNAAKRDDYNASFELVDNDGKFARVKVQEGPRHYFIYLKNVAGVWAIIGHSLPNGETPSELTYNYGAPEGWYSKDELCRMWSVMYVTADGGAEVRVEANDAANVDKVLTRGGRVMVGCEDNGWRRMEIIDDYGNKRARYIRADKISPKHPDGKDIVALAECSTDYIIVYDVMSKTPTGYPTSQALKTATMNVQGKTVVWGAMNGHTIVTAYIFTGDQKTRIDVTSKSEYTANRDFDTVVLCVSPKG
jgi:hypothetical protein